MFFGIGNRFQWSILVLELSMTSKMTIFEIIISHTETVNDIEIHLLLTIIYIKYHTNLLPALCSSKSDLLSLVFTHQFIINESYCSVIIKNVIKLNVVVFIKIQSSN